MGWCWALARFQAMGSGTVKSLSRCFAISQAARLQRQLLSRGLYLVGFHSVQMWTCHFESQRLYLISKYNALGFENK